MSRITKISFIALWLVAAAGAAGVLVITSAFLYLSPGLPSVDVLKDIKLQTPLRIYSADGELIGEFGEKRRTPITFEQIPPRFVQAILAAEDDRFFSHHGVDITGLLRAASQLLVSGQIQTGGSTITMQVAKNYFLTLERTFSRKFNEIFLALQIERELEKEEILTLYLNKIFLGNRAYGIEAAAQVYYGKSIDQLDLAQWAMIAGLPKAPSRFNPIVNPSRALIRRNWILGRMKELGHISDSEYQLAKARPITASYHGTQLEYAAPYAAEMARQFMLEQFGNTAYTDGFSVYTTLDSRLQQRAEQAVVDGLLAYDRRHGYRGAEAQLQGQPDAEAIAAAMAAPATMAASIELEPEDQPARPEEDDNGVSEPTDSAAASTELSPLLQQWQATLRQQRVIAGLQPAVVTSVEEQSFTALLRDGSIVPVAWAGIADWRPYINPNRRGSKPQRAEQLVQTGDRIRLQQSADGSWSLSQLPDAEAALVAVNADNGAILSLVGGFDYRHSKFNRITQAQRQPGSNFKPFIYAAALEHGFTAATMINDAPIVFNDAGLEDVWRPTNSSGKFYGPTRLRQALFKSRNLVSIRLLRQLGINKAIDYSGLFGFDTRQLPRDLSLALGSHSLRPLDIVNGYAILANGGYRVSNYLIQRVDDINGETLFTANPATVCRDCDQPPALDEIGSIEELLADDSPPPAERVIRPEVAYIMDSMLRDVVQLGTARRARQLNRADLGGKTGTTNGPTDAWFSGYGGGIAATTWLGFDDNGVLGSNEYGGSAALPIWIDYMQLALQDRPLFQQPQPEGIVTVKIDPDSGLLARPNQSNAIFEIFRTDLAPTATADSVTELPDSFESSSEETELF